MPIVAWWLLGGLAGGTLLGVGVSNPLKSVAPVATAIGTIYLLNKL